jgi:uncharacterized protein with von Willebrand factor type A (vWA) domain
VKRILYEVPRWDAFMHRLARGLDPAHDGDEPRRKFEDELFERLYDGEMQPLAEGERDTRLAPWATKVHEACQQLPAFERLAAECRGDADAAGAAVEKLIEELKDLAADSVASAVRSGVRAAAAAASTAVDELREAIAGLEHVSPGTAPLGRRLRDDARLRRIAVLAGRFKRIAATKRRHRARHGADEITDLELGADIGRILPSELARLRVPKLRLALLRDLAERRCLQYQLTGTEALGRGPLVMVVDKSGSMDGAPDEWATAVALALLGIAQAESRTFGLLNFNSDVTFSAVVRLGEALPEAALAVSCSGGTDISKAIGAALDIIKGGDVIRAADVVLITDGASDAAVAEQVRARANELDVTILGIGIGVEQSALAPWCDEIEVVTATDSLSGSTSDALFGG